MDILAQEGHRVQLLIQQMKRCRAVDGMLVRMGIGNMCSKRPLRGEARVAVLGLSFWYLIWIILF